MQTLQTKQKIAISIGVVAAVIALSAALAVLTLAQIGANENREPTSKVPVPGNDVPEMVVVPGNRPTSSGMPVPGNDAPEMIVTPS